MCGAPLQAQDQQDRTLIQLSAPFQANPGLLQLPPPPAAAAHAAIALAAAAAAEFAAIEPAAAAAASGTTTDANADVAAATRPPGRLHPRVRRRKPIRRSRRKNAGRHTALESPTRGSSENWCLNVVSRGARKLVQASVVCR